MEGEVGERKFSLISQMEPLNNPHFHSFIPMQQQPQPHEMVALKKAYAEVILNTAKEAAARVMASEQKALRFWHELDSVKEESLHMLLRLKQMIDAKTVDAERASLNQQNKIEELEAQLNEAEDIITDLREELKHVRLELEKTRNSQAQSLDGQNAKQVASIFQDSAKPETLVSSTYKELEGVNPRNKSPSVNVLDDKCCNSRKQTEQSSILEEHSAHDSDFASNIMRSKEPELCKNGFTQRIRAVYGNLLDRKPLIRNMGYQHFGRNQELFVKDRNDRVAKLIAPSARTEKMEMKKHVKRHKKPKRKIFSCCRSCFLSSCKMHINGKCTSNKGVCSLPSIKPRGISRWKRKNRKRHVGMKYSIFKICKPSFVLKPCSAVCDNGKCCEDEYVAKMNPVTPLTDVETVHGSAGVTETFPTDYKFEPMETDIKKDNEISNLEESAALNSIGPTSDIIVEVVDIQSANTDLENAKAFEESYGSPGQVDDRRFLKYTFQRKRKKESLGNLDQKIDTEKSTMIRRVEDKENDALEISHGK